MENEELKIEVETQEYPKQSPTQALGKKIVSSFLEEKSDVVSKLENQQQPEQVKIKTDLKKMRFIDSDKFGLVCFPSVIISLTLGIGGLVHGDSWQLATYITLTVFGGIVLFSIGWLADSSGMTGEQIRNKIEEEEPSELTSEIERLKKEISLYQQFFSKREEIIEIGNLKKSLEEEEKEWLEIYCAAWTESNSSEFARQQLERAKRKIGQKISSEKLEKLLEFSQLNQQLEKLQLQEQEEFQTQIQVLPK